RQPAGAAGWWDDQRRRGAGPRQYVHRHAAAPEGVLLANELILIVEDNEKNLKLARDGLRFHGFRTVEATDGESAIALSVEHLPALVLMDIQLPGMDGIAAMKRIRADARTKHIPT